MTALRVIAWHDSLTEEHGHPAESLRTEREWLPILGPTAMAALRRMAVDVAAGPVTYDLDVLAAELGVPGRKDDRLIVRALDRLERFGAARMVAGSLMVRTHLMAPRRRKEAA